MASPGACVVCEEVDDSISLVLKLRVVPYQRSEVIQNQALIITRDVRATGLSSFRELGSPCLGTGTMQEVFQLFGTFFSLRVRLKCVRRLL